jgi:phosphohistidine phosphatase
MTVRTLVLLRHAKAANPERVADSDRPLTARGHADAAAAGAWLLARGLRPARVLCSPSRRTRETWHSVRVALGDAGDSAEVVMEPALYHSGAGTALDLIRATDPDVDVLVVVGHNPTVSMIAARLDPGTEVDDDGLRTAGLALHSIDGEWADCVPGAAPLTATHTARASD